MAQLETAIIELATDLAAAEARWLGLVAEFDERQGWAVYGVVSCAHWLSWRCGLSLHSAREKVRVARALHQLPKVVESFEKGELSYARARAITRVATPDNEEALVETARHSTGAQLERICRATHIAQATDEGSLVKPSRRSVTYYWADDGMLVLRARLDADEGAAVIAALEAAQAADWNDRAQQTDDKTPDQKAPDDMPAAGLPSADDMPAATDLPSADDMPAGAADPHAGTDASADAEARHDADQTEHTAHTEHPEHGEESAEVPTFSRADALVAVAETYLGGQRMTKGTAGADVYQVVLHVRDGEHARLEDGPGLEQPDALRLLCDASVYCVHTDAAGNPMDIGRTTRKIPTALRKALWLRDGGCRFPGCGRRRRVDGHHIQHWIAGGPTALRNLVLLCRRHHRAIHRDDFSVVLSDDGQPHFHAPDGSEVPQTPTMPAASGQPRRWHAAPVEPAAIDTQWAGEQVDLDYVASVLATRRPQVTDGGDQGSSSTGEVA